MKAYQRKIREQKAKEVHFDNLFGKWWEQEEIDLSKATVREVSHDTAKHIIEDYEWMGRLPAISLYYYGIFFGGNCGGVVVFSPEYVENLGAWDKYGYTGKIILLSRGACCHWTPPNTASKLVRRAIAMLPAQYEVVTATVDPQAGEIGTIYQACGFHYTGPMWKGQRFGIKVGGQIYGCRTMRHRHNNQAEQKLEGFYPGAEYVRQTVKGRYFCFRGSQATQAQHYEALKHLIKPYPKRDEPEQEEARPPLPREPEL